MEILSNHEFQKPDLCGPAIIRIILKITHGPYTPSQDDIAKEVIDNGWCYPENVEKYLKKFYKDVVRANGNIDSLMDELSKGRVVMILWRDDLPDKDLSEPDGHWSIVGKVNVKKGFVTLVDPSNAERIYDEEGNVLIKLKPQDNNFKKRLHYNIPIDEFVKRWWDYKDDEGSVLKGQMISIDPNTSY